MTTTHRVVVTFGPELLDAVRIAATIQNLDVPTFCRNAVRSQLSRMNGPKARERRSREAGFEVLCLLSGQPAGERQL
jgi:hypothetical protein